MSKNNREEICLLIFKYLNYTCELEIETILEDSGEGNIKVELANGNKFLITVTPIAEPL